MVNLDILIKFESIFTFFMSTTRRFKFRCMGHKDVDISSFPSNNIIEKHKIENYKKANIDEDNKCW